MAPLSVRFSLRAASGLTPCARALLLAAPMILAACGGGSSDGGVAAAPSGFTAGYGVKGYQFSWNASTGATRYELQEDPDGPGPLPEVQIGGNIAGTSYTQSLAGQLLHERVNASYRLRACDVNGCGAWTAALVPDLTQTIGRFETSKTGFTYNAAVALSANGATLAVGTPTEKSADGVLFNAGAVYLFSRETATGTWQQQAHLKASNPAQNAYFGTHLALSSNGDTLAVGAPQEPSNARGINGDGSNSDAPGSGAVYLFTRNGGNWSQQAYIKALNTPQKVETCQLQFWLVPCDPVEFGTSVALSADGNLLAVGAPREGTKGLHFGSPPDVFGNGAIHTYTRSNGAWTQQAHLKGSGPDAKGRSTVLGRIVALSEDGSTLATVGYQQSNLYVLTQVAGTWRQPTEVWQPPPSTSTYDLALSGDGKTIAYATYTVSLRLPETLEEIQLQTLTHSNGAWIEETLLTASDASLSQIGKLSLSSNGRTLAVGLPVDSSDAFAFTGDASRMTDQSTASGAVNLYRRDATTWRHSAYIKAPQPLKNARFGSVLALSSDGTTLAVSDGSDAYREAAKTVNAAVYLY